MRKTFAFLFLLYSFAAFPQQHPTDHCNYQSITTSNGLSSNYVFSLCEDENNFLWAGTDKGLCRYNGFNWQVWDKDNGLPGNYIATVLSDKRGGLWLDISEKGIFHFDIATGKTEKINQPKQFIDKKLQVDTHGDLFRVFPSDNIDGYAGTLLSPFNLSALKTVFEVKAFADAKLGIDLPSKSLFYISELAQAPKKTFLNSATWKLKYWEMPTNIHPGSIYSCNDSVLITNTHYYKFSPGKKLITDYELFDNNNTYAFNTISSNGYYVYNVKTGYYFIGNDGKKEFHDTKCGLGSDFINHVYEMHDGTILLSTLGAGLQWMKNDYQTSFSTGKTVRAIIKSGELWYGVAGNHLFKVNDHDNTFKVISDIKNSSTCLFKWQDQIFIGSLNGIEFYNINKGLQEDQFIIYNGGVSSIFNSGKELLASTYGNGMISFVNSGNKIIPQASAMHIIEKAVPLLHGYALLSYEDGVVLTDTLYHTNVHLTRAENLLSNSVQDVHQLGDTLWIATRNGISVFTKGKVVQNISYHDGFTGTKAMYCFHYNKQLWVVSEKYLHVYDGTVLRTITSHPLFQSADEHVITAKFDSDCNTLAVGSEKSVTIIRLANISIHKEVSVPKILHVLVDGKPETALQIKIPYQFNKIVIDIAPYTSSPLIKGTFLYKLVGLDENWLELKDSLAVSYEGLRPGEYTLLAKIINADGYEGGEKIIASFKVNKPFWQKGWFILLIIVATILLTVFVVQQGAKRRERKFQAGLVLQQSLQQERERISKDLHDHLGSNLVTIVAQVDNIETKLKRGAHQEASITIKLLSAQAREVMTVLRETIWAVQENEHTLKNFIIRIRTFLQRLFESSGITWQLKILEDDEIRLSPKQTLQLFRIVQEASQNILKHSSATEANYSFRATKNTLSIKIADNGKGFTERREVNSNGLYNIQQRVILLGGFMTFSSVDGVVIEIEMPASGGIGI